MASECLKFDERPVTPKRVKKYRKSFFEEPGKRVTHFGSIDDREELQERLSDVRFGKTKTGVTDHVPDIFNQGRKSEISEYINDKKEAVYRSVQREPLGRSYIRGHDIPEEKGEEKSSHSVPGVAAKSIIYSRTKEDEDIDKKYRALYKKSHNSYQPGEQRKRDYDWNGIDPQETRFGVIDKKALASEGVSFCLNPDASEPQTRLVNLHVDQFKAANQDKLGKSRRRNFESSAPSISAAEATQKANEWSAAECIQGNYSVEEQLPDKDLGKAVRPGWRNVDAGNRSFGCPTVRTDIAAPKRRPLGDAQNYGDDPVASSLLYPSRFVEIGVQDEDFFAERNKEEIQEIFSSIGYDLTTEEFERIYGNALKTSRGRVSIEGFREALNDMLDAREAKATMA